MNSEEDEDKAIEALDGATWMGRPMKVNKARPRENNGQGQFRRNSASRF